MLKVHHPHIWMKNVYMSLSFIFTIVDCIRAYFNLGKLMQNFDFFLFFVGQFPKPLSQFKNHVPCEFWTHGLSTW